MELASHKGGKKILFINILGDELKEGENEKDKEGK